MADSGTLATTAQVLLAIGENASAAQILEANTNIWILYAEADISRELNFDLVTNNSDINAKFVQYFAMVAAHRAATYGINQDQNTWALSTTQSKLNICDNVWVDFKALAKDKDRLETMGLTF